LKKRRSKNKASQIILRKPSKLQILVAYRQSQKLKDLHQKRKEIGVILINKMIKRNIMENRIPNLEDITISKLFVFNKNFYYKDIVNFFKENSIEVMHLSHKSGSPYQPMLMSMEEAAVFELKNYLSIHDSIVSLPLIEDMDNKEIDLILDLFCEYLNKRKC
ncbi:MAG: hypothetical protein RBR68_15250, partial [Tenuifilaceae bacterium]|nr:hypothetical protein [Tenuifilaceae bacterium]